MGTFRNFFKCSKSKEKNYKKKYFWATQKHFSAKQNLPNSRVNTPKIIQKSFYKYSKSSKQHPIKLLSWSVYLKTLISIHKTTQNSSKPTHYRKKKSIFVFFMKIVHPETTFYTREQTEKEEKKNSHHPLLSSNNIHLH